MIINFTESYQSGLTVYALILDPATGQAWNGTAFVDRAANLLACLIPMVDSGRNTYLGATPASLPPGAWLVQSYLQAGPTPSASDSLIGTGSLSLAPQADFSTAYQSGLAVYDLIFDPVTSLAWNGSTFVDRSANWAACATPMADTGQNLYTGSIPPALPSGTWLVQSYLREGTIPAATDPLVGTGSVVQPGPQTDLVTAQYAIQVMAAGGVILNAAQIAILPSLIAAASREIARYCNRLFPLTTYAEIVTPEGGRQDRGEPAKASLSAFPVQDVTSIRTGRSGVVTIRNTDPVTNQFASVKFAITGDVEYFDLTYTGLTLSRTASGVTTNASVTFAANVTLASLATTINALGGGWNATVQGTFGPHPTASLVGVREPKNAMSNGAVLDLFVQDATGCDVDRSTGILRCYSNGWGSGLGGEGNGGFGDPWGDSFDGAGGFGGALGWGQYQVQYQAGWATIPEPLQLVAAEVVKLMFARLNSDPSLKSETADKYTWAAKASLANLSDDMMRTLMYYKQYQV